jgi:DNA-binding HxlR family transcriptional regulator
MKRVDHALDACPVGRSVDAVGEWWSLLIVREAMLGVDRFSDFERRLGVSKNALTARLGKLVERGVMTKEPDGRYRLTEAGEDLFTVITALRQWGDRWLFGPEHRPLRMRTRDGGEVARVEVRSTLGAPVGMEDVMLGPWPRA